MRSRYQALLWELWRTSNLELATRIGGEMLMGVFIASLLFGVLGAPLDGPQADVCCGVFVMACAVMSLASQSWIRYFESRQVGFSFRLGFARPLRTWELVLIPMAYTMAAAAVCYLVPVFLFGLLLGRPTPLVGPTAWIMAMSACLVSATWSPSTVIEKTLSLLGVIALIVFLLALYHAQGRHTQPFLFVLSRPGYFALHWYHFLVLLLLTGFAFLTTVLAVGRQRRGEPHWLSRFRKRSAATRPRGQAARPRSRRAPFRGPIAAQFWFEIRRYARFVFTFAAAAPLVIFAVVSVTRVVSQGWSGAPQVWLAAISFCPFVYQIFALEGALGLRHKQGITRYPPFDATRPLCNDQLIVIKLVVVAACSLSGWLAMSAAAWVHSRLPGEVIHWRSMLGGIDLLPPAATEAGTWVALVAILASSYIGTSAMLIACGFWMPIYFRRFAIGFAVVYAHGLLAVYDSGRGWSLHYLWTANAYLIAAAIVVGCVYLIWKARAQNTLRSSWLLLAVAAWLIYVASMVWIASQFAESMPIPLEAKLVALASLLLPLAALAAAPLALASHRHG